MFQIVTDVMSGLLTDRDETKPALSSDQRWYPQETVELLSTARRWTLYLVDACKERISTAFEL